MKKKLFVLSSLLLSLSSCNNVTYSYVNPNEPQLDFGPEVESGINVDGVGDDSFYDNENIYRIDNIEGEDNYATVKFGFGEKGFLAYAYVYTNEIYENSSVAIFEQYSFEIYINPGVYKDELRSNCAQFRISPLGRYESWRGIKSPSDNYTWTRTYVPFRHASKVDGKVISKSSQIFEEGYLSSQGVGYEFYIPYSSLDLSYNPKGFDILPAMVTAHSTEEDDHVWSSYNGVAIDDLNNYIKIGNREFTDQTGNLFNTDLTSSGFVLDHQNDETYPYVTNFGYHDQYAIFNAYSTNYYVKTRVKLYHELENDKFPKIGIGSLNKNGTIMMLLDPRPAKNVFETVIVERPQNLGWDWGSAPVYWAGEKTYDNPITLEIVRLGANIYYFMNGYKIHNGTADILGGENVPSYPSLMTMNYCALYDESYVTTDINEINARFENIGPHLSTTLSTGGYAYSEGTYTQSGGYDQYGVFNKLDTNYTMSVDIRLGDALNGDQHPKIGIGEINDNYINAYLFDPKPNKNNFEIVHVCSNRNNGIVQGWNWGSIFWGGENNYNRVFNLKVVRTGVESKIYVDNELVFTLANNNFNDNASRPMFLTMNHSGTFSNVSVL